MKARLHDEASCRLRPFDAQAESQRLISGEVAVATVENWWNAWGLEPELDALLSEVVAGASDPDDLSALDTTR